MSTQPKKPYARGAVDCYGVFLKWCPLCGGDAQTVSLADTNSATGMPKTAHHAHVFCLYCDLTSRGYGGESEDEARRRAAGWWNREPEDYRQRTAAGDIREAAKEVLEVLQIVESSNANGRTDSEATRGAIRGSVNVLESSLSRCWQHAPSASLASPAAERGGTQ